VFTHNCDTGKLSALIQRWNIVQQIEGDDYQRCQTYVHTYTTLKFLALQGTPYIYDISRLRVKSWKDTYLWYYEENAFLVCRKICNISGSLPVMSLSCLLGRSDYHTTVIHLQSKRTTSSFTRVYCSISQLAVCEFNRFPSVQRSPFRLGKVKVNVK
jgi:hypothetical protein